MAMPPTPESIQDPRTRITPDAFQVAPELLGMPLASPWRRLGAMLIDVFLLALLTNAGGVFLALAAAIALLRATTSDEASLLKRGVILSLRVAGALVLFVAVATLFDRASDAFEDEDRDIETVTVGDGGMRVSGGMGLARDLVVLGRAETREAAMPAAERFVDRLVESGALGSEDDLRSAISELERAEGEGMSEAGFAAVRQALAARLTEPRPVATDSGPSTGALLADYLGALESADTTALLELRPLVVDRLAGDTLAALGRRYEDARQRLQRTRRSLDQANAALEEQETNLGRMLMVTADELGVGLGWSWLYFTVFLVLWKGQTPGKRLLGIRVIRLDGRPLGWWASLERFGGYAAALLTGMIGFAQILWDRNRQGVHDKISETVVVRG